jgi:hypothetical protein
MALTGPAGSDCCVLAHTNVSDETQTTSIVHP